MEPKRYHHGDLKRTLLAVADKTLTESELSALSLRDVAKRAGVSHTAPYKHFKDKNELLQALVQHEFKNLLDFSQAVAWRLPEQIEAQLTAVAEYFFAIALNHPRKFKLLVAHIQNYSEPQIEALALLGIGETRAQIFWSALIGAGVSVQAKDIGSFTQSLVTQILD